MIFYVRKSVAEEFLKSVQDNKLEYFKREIIKILEKQNDITKSFDFQLFMIEKSGMGVGHISIYRDGSAWKKVQNNPPKWKCIRQAKTFNSETAGAKQSISKLINKVNDCKTTDELLDIVMFNIDRFRDDNGKILPIVEKLKSEVDIKKVIMSDDKKAAYDNLMDYVNEKNFNDNIKLTRDEIFAKYDNTPKKIAKLPKWLNDFLGSGNGFINCGKAYIIDHMVHNHPTTPLPLYRRIQYILDSAKEFYFDTKTGVFCLVEEYGNKKGKPCKNFLIFKKDENGNLILHKTFYDTTKNIPGKFKKYGLADIQQGLTSEMVEHTIIGRSEDNSAPARGSISGRSDSSNISQSKDLSSKKDNSFNTIEDVKKAYQGTDKWLKAPNGKDSKLDEKQWCQVRTENFKKWFGDWENNPKSASKIVDENGEPLINYHGTSSDFNEFVKNEIGKVTNNAGIFGNGFYFTNGKKLAENYSKYNKEKQGKVIEGFLNIKKPFIWSEKRNVAVARKLGFPESRIKNGSLLPLNDDKQIMKFTESLKNAGYDGVIFNYKKGTGGRFEEDYVVNETVIFEPNQIKSAENNDGKFDSNSNNINKSFSLKVRDVLQGKVV